MRHHPSIGDAVGYAMAHNARLAADHPNADRQEQHMTDQAAPCRSTRHCATHDFCHRCTPDLTVASKYLVKAISAARIDDERKGAVYAQLAAGIRDAARQASGQQPDSATAHPGRCPVMFQGVGRCEKDADHRAGRWPDDPHTPEPAPAAGLSDTQPANDRAAEEARPPVHRWAVELHDPLAGEWAPGTRYLDRDQALDHLANARAIGPRWKDGTPVDRRLVRETTTWTVEEDETR
ncbi:hypothetical protein ACN9M0_24890 [Streptomyces sp. R-07]|uniref:hypothetical protein n=1 Tax=Streptomyces sp. R-07 TaxID=3404052 RepID=UPI003CF5A37D